MSKFERAFNIAAATFDRELGDKDPSRLLLAFLGSFGAFAVWVAYGAPSFGGLLDPAPVAATIVLCTIVMTVRDCLRRPWKKQDALR